MKQMDFCSKIVLGISKVCRPSDISEGRCVREITGGVMAAASKVAGHGVYQPTCSSSDWKVSVVGRVTLFQFGPAFWAGC